MNIKKLFSYIDKIPFSYKTTILIFIITGGMFSIVILSQLSIYTLKNDFDVLFEKRTKPIIKLEAIKDAYKINIYDTLYDIQHENISVQQSLDVITLGQQLINKNWGKYQDSTIHKKYQPSFITTLIKQFFDVNPSSENKLLLDNIIDNINKKQSLINKDINAIVRYLQHKNFSSAYLLIDELYIKINSINIYLTNLTNYDLNMAITEKLDTQKTFNILTMILNLSIVFVFVSSILLSVLLIINFKKLHFGLEDEVYEKTKELQTLNASLEQRIKKEVANSRKKDIIMMQQARHASLGEMIANIAHQWRQPLGSLMMIIQSFQTKMELGKLSNEFVNKKVEDAMLLSDNMSNTLDDFQNFFKPNKDKTIFSLQECLEHAYELSKYFLEKEGIKVILHVKQNVNVHGFYNELSHVFLNIFSNSKDALKKIDEKRLIEVIVKKNKETVTINIFDNGGGIDEKIMPQVFEPYFTTKYKSAGTGIGLYMSKQIIEKHMHGTISCKNIFYKINKTKFQHCTMFVITIPYHKG